MCCSARDGGLVSVALGVVGSYSLVWPEYFQTAHMRVLAIQMVGDNHDTQMMRWDGWAVRVFLAWTEGDDDPAVWLYELAVLHLMSAVFKGSPAGVAWGYHRALMRLSISSLRLRVDQHAASFFPTP